MVQPRARKYLEHSKKYEGKYIENLRKGIQLRKTSKAITLSVCLLTIIIGIFIIISGFIGFEISKRNIDMGWNIQVIEYMFLENGMKADLADVGLDGVVRDNMEMYFMSLEQLNTAVFLISIGFIMISLGLCALTYELSMIVNEKFRLEYLLLKKRSE